jgi:glycosyltransferase involved in cell wall biosynthesis
MEMVAEGGNGYTVPTRDAKALADAMLRYMSLSAEEKLRMSSMSRSLAESRFSIETVIEEYKAIISQKHC